MFNNMTIKSRLVLVIGMLSILLIGVGSLGIYGLNQTNDSFRGVYEDRAVPLGDLGFVLDRMQRIRLNTVMASYAEDSSITKERKSLSDQSSAEVVTTWQKYMATTLTPAESTLVDSFNQQWKTFLESSDRSMSLAISKDYESAKANINADTDSKFDAVHTTMFKLLELQRDEASKEYAEAQNNYQSIFMTTTTVITVGILLAVILGFLLIRSLLAQLGGEPKYAAEVMQKIASGDLSGDIAVNTKYSNSTLFAIKEMQDSLIKIIREIRSGTDTISTASSEIASGN